MNKKTYIAAQGVLIDDCFANHVHNCETCKKFDVEKPATVALLCLEGSVLWKRENGVKVAPEREQRGENITSKDAVRRAMRYK